MLEVAPEQRNLLMGLLRRRLPHVKAMAFGSRVAGWPFGRGAKPYSDLDIALFGLLPSDVQALAHLRADLEESTLPWRVDLSDAADLPPDLRSLIVQSGVAVT